ncbi:trk system potassium uptake protein TrkH [Elusimicrobium simillimum]|uniref:TrkH family potassium uptake protein n=1 Tax=Elusimicrobium simillimum TaxID=3143438 RepID=UPI003C6FC4C6
MKINSNSDEPPSSRLKNFLKGNLKKYLVFLLHLSPYQNLTFTVFLYTIIGWVLLSIPFISNNGVSLLDNLFTSASAVTTTGLNSVNFANSYTFFGKVVVLLIIQACGIGYMTITSFLHLSLSQRIAHRHKEVLNVEFSLPNNLRLKDFLKAVVTFTLLVEITGAVFLFNYFNHHGYGFWQSLYYGVFHSISAFCTAGFSLFPNSLESFADSKTINIVISILSLCGAIGFIVVTDLFNRVTRKTTAISYTTKIILFATSIMLVFGTFFIYITNNINLAESFFQTMSAMTTVGFNTTSMQTMSLASVLILIVLMCIGASPSGTGGGIKTTAVTAVMAVVYNRIKGSEQITFLGRRIPLVRLYIATSTFIFYVLVLFVSVFLLACTEKATLADLLFEAASALGTVGLSRGITEDLSVLGKIIIIFTMIIGRVGVITFGMSLLRRQHQEPRACEREDLAV